MAVTKEQLLAFAHHSSKEVSNAYQDRIFEELLKPQGGLISFEDIKFTGENAFNANDFYQDLADKIRKTDVSDKRSLWTVFFEVIRQDQNNIPAICAAICYVYAESGATIQVKDRCLSYLNSVKKTTSDEGIICALLKNAESNRFQCLALYRINRLDKHSPAVISAVDALPKSLFEFQLSACKALLQRKIKEQNVGLAKVLVKALANFPSVALLSHSKEDLQLARLLKETQETLVLAMKEFAPNASLDSLVSNVISLENIKSLTAENAIKVFCSVLENASKDSADYSVTCSLEALNILAPKNLQVAKEVYETLFEVMSFESFYVKNLALLVMSNVYSALDPESPLTEDYALLYGNNIGNLRQAKQDVYMNCLISWMPGHWHNFLLTIKNAPDEEKANLLAVVAKHHPEFWSEAFTALDWKNVKDINALMLGLIKLSTKYPLARIAITESIKEIASLHIFKENEALEIRLQLLMFFWFEDVQIKDDVIPRVEIDSLLALLKD